MRKETHPNATSTTKVLSNPPHSTFSSRRSSTSMHMKTLHRNRSTNTSRLGSSSRRRSPPYTSTNLGARRRRRQSTSGTSTTSRHSNCPLMERSWLILINSRSRRRHSTRKTARPRDVWNCSICSTLSIYRTICSDTHSYTSRGIP